jgi:molybdopterin adenylyltransferase
MTHLACAVLTVSDTRTPDTDTSGTLLAELLQADGHRLHERGIVPDDVYRIRAEVSRWIADPAVDVILTTGGTGFTGRDSTPEALAPLFDKDILGFGELFRQLSYAEIGASTIQSRALAGLANATLVFALPGSSNAVRTGWEKILHHPARRDLPSLQLRRADTAIPGALSGSVPGPRAGRMRAP